MKLTSSRKKTTNRLAQGQIWKTECAFIEIVGLGIRLIDYRIMNQLGQKRVRTQTSGIQSMEDYLKTNKARLITTTQT
jgi:hypothetical protein